MDLFRTVKKLYKTGLFWGFTLKKNYLSYRDCNRTLYVLQLDIKSQIGLFIFSIGHVESWTETGLTYETGYNDMGEIQKSAYIDHVKPVRTDNPDYVLRESLYNVLGYLPERNSIIYGTCN